MLAFWNGGDPKVVRNPKRVPMPNGDIRFNATPDPDDDLYAFVPAPKVPEGKKRSGYTYDNDGWTVTQTNVLEDVTAVRAREIAKWKIKAHFEAVISGGIVFTTNGLKLASTDRVLGLLMSMIGRAADGTDIESAVKFTTLDGTKISSGADAATRLANFKQYRDEVAAHWAACMIVRDTHLAAVDALPDSPVAEIVSYDHGATSDYAAADDSYALAQGWPVNPEVSA